MTNEFENPDLARCTEVTRTDVERDAKLAFDRALKRIQARRWRMILSDAEDRDPSPTRKLGGKVGAHADSDDAWEAADAWQSPDLSRAAVIARRRSERDERIELPPSLQGRDNKVESENRRRR